MFPSSSSQNNARRACPKAKVYRSIDKVYTEEMEEHAAEDEICKRPVSLSVFVLIMARRVLGLD
jgi:hypothetical protein